LCQRKPDAVRPVVESASGGPAARSPAIAVTAKPAPALPPIDASAPHMAARLRFLQRCAVRWNGGPPGPVTRIETHMSWVLLARDRVLKLKKPVRHAFLDFSTVAAREHACREELRLNARLAPGVYLGLRVLRWQRGRLALSDDPGSAPRAAGGDASGQILDWLVLMHRLPVSAMLDQQLAAGTLRADDLTRLVAMLAAFYRQAPRVNLGGTAYLARLRAEHALNRQVLLGEPYGGAVDEAASARGGHRARLPEAAAVLDRLDAARERLAADLAARAEHGALVEGHGDLRPEHIALLPAPVVIDALEFNRALREVDPLDELAFLALECALAGARGVSDALRAAEPPPAPSHAPGHAHGAATDVPERLRLFYTAHRAALRARLAMAHLLDPVPRTPQRWPPLARRYLAAAADALQVLATRASCGPHTRA
jgi:uncharacterized protein